MPMYMDIHEVHGATADDVAKAHVADVEVQSKHGVEYHKYWFNESLGKIFCLCSAPSPEAAETVHREAHGLVAERIIEVAPEVAEGFLGGMDANPAGAAVVPGGAGGERDPGIRTVLFTDIVGSTALTQSMGDEAAMAFLQVHDRIVREALGASGGREVKHTGDGIMASFHSRQQGPPDQGWDRRCGRGARRGSPRSVRRYGSARGSTLRPRRAGAEPGLDRPVRIHAIHHPNETTK